MLYYKQFNPSRPSPGLREKIKKIKWRRYSYMADDFAFCFKYSFTDLNRDFGEKNTKTDFQTFLRYLKWFSEGIQNLYKSIEVPQLWLLFSHNV